MSQPPCPVRSSLTRSGNPGRRAGAALRLALLSLLFGGAALPGCGDDSTAVLVQLGGVNLDYVQSLYVYATLDGKPAMQGLDIKPPSSLSTFGLQLPAGTRGALVLEVSGLGEGECKYAVGKTQVDLTGEASVTVQLTLDKLGTPQCTLIVTQRGDGQVVPTPAGKSCGTGCYDYDQGTLVQLSATPAGSSYGAAIAGDFSGSCEGGSCDLTIKQRTKLSVGFPGYVCTGRGWCWQSLGPQGNWLNGFWGASVSDVWAVGFAGTLLHNDGFGWTQPQRVTDKNLRGIWGASASDIWAVGDGGLLLRYNGTSWSEVTGPTQQDLYSVWGASATDVWAVGDKGTLLHYNGTSWTVEQSNTSALLRKVKGSGASNVWIVGEGVVLSSTGSGFSRVMDVPTTTTTSYYDVWTGSADSVAIVGTNGFIGTLGGGRWSTVTNSTLRTFYGVWASSPSDIWVAGETNALIYSADGKTFSTLGSSIQAGTDSSYVAIWGLDKDNVFVACANGNILQLNKYGGYTLARSKATRGPYLGIWGNDNNDVWAAAASATTASVVGHWDGARWSEERPFTGDPLLYRVWTSPGDVWVSAELGRVYRKQGAGAWMSSTAFTGGDNATALWGAAPGDVWAGSNRGNFSHFSGGVWTTTSTPYTFTIQAIWGRSATDIWAVGNVGYVFRYTGGSSWTDVSPTSFTKALYAVGGATGSSDVWAAGESGSILRRVGSTWTPVTSPTTQTLTSIYAVSASEIYFAGNNGVLLKWNGSTVDAVPAIYGVGSMTARNDFNRLWGTGGTDFWAAASNGAILHYQPQP